MYTNLLQRMSSQTNFKPPAQIAYSIISVLTLFGYTWAVIRQSSPDVHSIDHAVASCPMV